MVEKKIYDPRDPKLSALKLSQLPPEQVLNPLAERCWISTVVWALITAATFYWSWTLYIAGQEAHRQGKAVTDAAIADVVPVFLCAMVIEYVVTRLQGKEVYRLNDTLCCLSNGALQQVVELCTVILGHRLGLTLISAAIPYHWLFEHWCLSPVVFDGLPGFFLCWIVRDVCYSLFHYYSHVVGGLWAVHAVHHEPAQFSYATNVSQGAIQSLCSAPFFAVCALLGFDPCLFAPVYVASKTQGFWSHTVTLKKTYLLEYFLVTPSSHRVHHAGGPSVYIDKNFGEVFPFFDMLFGTYQQELPTHPIRFGLVHPKERWSPLHSQLHVWKGLWQKSRFPGAPWYSPLLAIARGPGWDPSQGFDGEYPLADDTPYSCRKYDADLSWPWTIYALSHYLPALAALVAALVAWRAMPLGLVASIAAWLVMTVVSVGFLYDKRPFALMVETGRLLATSGLLIHCWQRGWLPGDDEERNARAVYAYVAAAAACVVGLSLARWNLVELTEEYRQKECFIQDFGREFDQKVRKERESKKNH